MFFWDFPGSPAVNTPCFHCRRHGCEPGSAAASGDDGGDVFGTLHTSFDLEGGNAGADELGQRGQLFVADGQGARVDARFLVGGAAARQLERQAIEERHLIDEALGGRHGDLGTAQERDDERALFLPQRRADVVDDAHALDRPARGDDDVHHVDEILGLAALAHRHAHVAVAQALAVLGAEVAGEQRDELGVRQLIEEERRRLGRVDRRAAADDEDASVARQALHAQLDKAVGDLGESRRLAPLKEEIDEADGGELVGRSGKGDEVGEKPRLAGDEQARDLLRGARQRLGAQLARDGLEANGVWYVFL